MRELRGDGEWCKLRDAKGGGLYAVKSQEGSALVLDLCVVWERDGVVRGLSFRVSGNEDVSPDTYVCGPIPVEPDRVSGWRIRG